MKAIVYTKYGPPDVLQIQEIAKPAPKGDEIMLRGSWISMTGSKKIGMLMPKANGEDLIHLKELLEAGKVAPVIDRCYTLSEVPEAIGYLERGHARGKVVITVEHSD